jgi:hypothetical protein
MRFPEHAYFFDLVKGDFKFKITNEVVKYEIEVGGQTTTVSKEVCKQFVSALQKLGFEIHGC